MIGYDPLSMTGCMDGYVCGGLCAATFGALCAGAVENIVPYT